MGHVHEPDYFYGDQDESVESFGAFRISRPRLSTTHSYDYTARHGLRMGLHIVERLVHSYADSAGSAQSPFVLPGGMLRQRRDKPGVQRGAQHPLGQTAMFNIAMEWTPPPPGAVVSLRLCKRG